LAELRARLGTDPGRWSWGELHTLHSEHRPFSKIPTLARVFDLRAPSGGDRYTVNVSQNQINNLADPYAATHGPSLRALYDFSDLENSRFIHSTGQSGNRLSPLYDNFAARWQAVDYIPMQMLRTSVDKGALGTLRLTP
jgi:penicillin amidase